MNAVVEAIDLPEPVTRRGITEPAWRTLMTSLYPGASGNSVLMVWDYCMARKLDPLKKPCHIVPMKVGNAYRDVVLPGIYEYRTTAHRTGQYMGHSVPTYGELKDFGGVQAPEFCKLTIYRWNAAAAAKGSYPVKVFFSEVVALKDGKPNSRWTKAPTQMLTKCTEAAALREAFPDELGGVPTAEEMEGQDQPRLNLGPQMDTSDVDLVAVDKYVGEIQQILNQDKTEAEIAAELRDADSHLQKFPELFQVVFDQLAARSIISKANYRKYLKL